MVRIWCSWFGASDVLRVTVTVSLDNKLEHGDFFGPRVQPQVSAINLAMVSSSSLSSKLNSTLTVETRVVESISAVCGKIIPSGQWFKGLRSFSSPSRARTVSSTCSTAETGLRAVVSASPSLSEAVANFF